MSTPDAMQERLARYACELHYDMLPPDVVHTAKVRIIDTLAALVGGYFGETCQLARNLAVRYPDPQGATVIGTRTKATPEMAAFANATTSRYVEMNDVYHWPGSNGGHPSDVVMPVLAVAEQMQSTGRELITAVVLAYEYYLRFSDAIKTWRFDQSNFETLGVAAAAAKLMKLSPQGVSHAIAMAATSSNITGQVRLGHLSDWKAIAAGQAGRAGVFAAEMARAGIDGPHLAFEGKSGWCHATTGGTLTLAPFGGEGGRGGQAGDFKIMDVLIKQRASCATTISSILAAEKAAVGLRGRLDVIKSVTTEVYEKAKINMGTGEHHWNPASRETADHSIPYVTAASLVWGTVTPRQFSDACVHDPKLRAVLAKVEVVTNDDYTRDYEQLPVLHRTRVTVTMNDGEKLVGESGGDLGDLSNPKSDAEIEEKFHNMAQDCFGPARVRALLDSLWKLEYMQNVAQIPPAFVVA